MTVAELITLLQTLPQDLTVCIPDTDGFDPVPVKAVDQEPVTFIRPDAIPGPFRYENYSMRECVVLRG